MVVVECVFIVCLSVFIYVWHLIYFHFFLFPKKNTFYGKATCVKIKKKKTKIFKYCTTREIKIFHGINILILMIVE